MEAPCCINIQTEQDIVTARQTGRAWAKEMGYGNIEQSRVATTISELARNIFLYAKQGTITLKKVEQDGKTGLSITAEDQGPGIDDIRQAMDHGYSTSGGLGAGLPGVRRMMDEFRMKSTPRTGTTVIVIKWKP